MSFRRLLLSAALKEICTRFEFADKKLLKILGLETFKTVKVCLLEGF